MTITICGPDSEMYVFLIEKKCYHPTEVTSFMLKERATYVSVGENVFCTG